MKFRKPDSGLDEQAERALEDEIRALAGPSPDGPPPAFWQNLLVRTNARIDDVASGKSITISWAARVAIPGVVAILAFLVGLHYYGPTLTADRDRLADLIGGLSVPAQDSLMERYAIDAETLVPAVAGEVFNVTVSQAQEYYLDHAELSALSELLNEDQVSFVLTALESSPRAPDGSDAGGS